MVPELAGELLLGGLDDGMNFIGEYCDRRLRMGAPCSTEAPETSPRRPSPSRRRGGRPARYANLPPAWGIGKGDLGGAAFSPVSPNSSCWSLTAAARSLASATPRAPARSPAFASVRSQATSSLIV